MRLSRERRPRGPNTTDSIDGPLSSLEKQYLDQAYPEHKHMRGDAALQGI